MMRLFTFTKSIFSTSVSWLMVLFFMPNIGTSQQVKNVPEAFKALSQTPINYKIKNTLEIPTQGGHLQGVQWISNKGIENLLISGSSSTNSYMLQVDLEEQRTLGLYSLMHKPYKHAGGIQVSQNYLIVGIEDNDAKTTSKVCVYEFLFTNPDGAIPKLTILREGAPKTKTAGATGLLKMEKEYLTVVSNWDSRIWDFYLIDHELSNNNLVYSFKAPDEFGNYQSINLIKDKESIYAIGFYGTKKKGCADLILVSHLGSFQPIMKKVLSKTFHSKKRVDFNTAAGLQVDKQGKLIIWATERNASKRFFINKFIQD